MILFSKDLLIIITDYITIKKQIFAKKNNIEILNGASNNKTSALAHEQKTKLYKNLFGQEPTREDLRSGVRSGGNRTM